MHPRAASDPDAEDSAARQSLSVRLPLAVHRGLYELRKQTGTSMNSLITQAVVALLEQPDLLPVIEADINSQIARDAVRQNPSSIGPLKGIAKHLRNRNQIALAGVLWAAAARLVAAQDGPEAAARDLSRSASVCEPSHPELAVALHEEALKLDPANLTAANRLGQLLHHQAQRHGDDIARYRDAERYLAQVTFVDNHAKLFHGWAALHVARADGDVERQQRALGELEEALKSWAFGQGDGRERGRWLRQARRLSAIGFDDEAETLIDFANRNSHWEPFAADELSS